MSRFAGNTTGISALTNPDASGVTIASKLCTTAQAYCTASSKSSKFSARACSITFKSYVQIILLHFPQKALAPATSQELHLYRLEPAFIDIYRLSSLRNPL